MQSFKEYFNNICNENNIAGDGGVFGDVSSGGWSATGTHYNYANNDTRIPKVLNKAKKSNKKHGKKIKKTKKSTKFEYFRR